MSIADIDTDGGTYNVKKVAAIAHQLAEQFIGDSDLEGYKRYGGLEVIIDPLDPTVRCATPLALAAWAATKTDLAVTAPMVLALSGACSSSDVAMPAFIGHLSTNGAFVETVAKLHSVTVATYTVLADIVVNHLLEFGHELVAQVIEECYNGEDLSDPKDIVQFVKDHWALTSIGTYVPTAGLEDEQVSDIIGTYMLDCEDDFVDVSRILSREF